MTSRFRLSALLLFITLALALALGAASCGVGDAKARPDEPADRSAGTETAAAGDYRISGPFVHENLSVFLIHGAERGSGGEMLTLEEAMAAKKLIVHETGTVNELEVENVGAEEIFIQASEIVKGGQQDRALAVDMIVPPKSGRVPIAAFCVEKGRWAKRGGEEKESFSGSSAALNSKELRIAAKYDSDQSKVWSAVARSQEKLASSVGARVTDERSASSLQLTLEHADVGKLADAYVAKLEGLLATPASSEHGPVIGYAFAINGAVNTADVYGSSRLFRKLWPKLLRAAAVEAVAERLDSSRGTVGVAEISAVLEDAERGASVKAGSAGAARSVAFESEKNLLFETRAGETREWVHRNYVTK